MSLHYSDERALSSGEVKRQALEHFFHIAAHHPQAAACLDGKIPSLPKGSFTWQEVAQLAALPAGPSSSTPALPEAMVATAPLPQCRPQLGIEDAKQKKDKKEGHAKKEKKDRKKCKKDKDKQRQRDRPHRKGSP